MNYIELINQFWEAREITTFTSVDADLYFAILNKCNRIGWKNPFPFSNRQIGALLNVSEKTLIASRNRLKQSGLIDFTSGKADRTVTIYKINYCKNYSSEVSSSFSSEVSSSFSSGGENSPDFLKQKTETKIKEAPLPPPDEKPLKVKSKKVQPDALQFPVVSEKFIEVWNKLVAMPNWKKKLPLSLQMSLDKLAKYDEAFSIELMKRAIEGNYRGVVFNDTDTAYLKWKSQNKNGNGQRIGQIIQPKDEDRKKQLLKNFT